MFREPVSYYDALGDGLHISGAAGETKPEIPDPSQRKLFISSKPKMPDLVPVLRVFQAEMKRRHKGSNEIRTQPVGIAAARVTNRKLDPDQHAPYRPYHAP